MKRLFLLSLFASRLCAQTDYVVNITEPESGVVGVSYTGWAGKLTINVDGANPDDISSDPTSYTVRDAFTGSRARACLPPTAIPKTEACCKMEFPQ